MNTDHDKSNNSYQQLLQKKQQQKKKRPDSTSAENIDSPNFINIEKVYAHYSAKPPLCEMLGQSH